MKQLLIIASLTLLALVWLTEFIHRLLAVLWPVAAIALMVVTLSGALAGSLYLLGLSLHTLRPPAMPVEVLTPDMGLHTFGRSVFDAFTPPNSQHAHRDRWNTALLQFAFVGDLDGFAVLKMQPYISRAHRQTFVDLLARREPPIMISDAAGTRWADGWSRHQLRAMLKSGLLSLPYPEGDPPRVNLSRLAKHAQHTQHAYPSQPNTPGVVYLSPMRNA